MKRFLFACLCILLFAVFAQAQVAITFGWDPSIDAGSPTHQVTYKLYLCSDEALTNCTGTSAGTNLELRVIVSAGLTYVYATALWDAVEGHPELGQAESGKSNILPTRVWVPPGNPGNFKIKIVTVP